MNFLYKKKIFIYLIYIILNNESNLNFLKLYVMNLNYDNY